MWSISCPSEWYVQDVHVKITLYEKITNNIGRSYYIDPKNATLRSVVLNQDFQ